MSQTREFKPLNIAVLVVSDTRSEADDVSGKVLVDRLTQA
ncbi:MAG: molybdenum cofactor biosynthesis protein, partial [Methylococcales bacterium]